MSGGRSARELAEKKKAQAEALRRKADRIAGVGANYEQGAQGEEEISWELDSLGSQGWFLLHDRKMASGGNIDHLAIGPAGVFVVESKNWSGHVQTESGKLLVGGKARSKPVVQVERQVEAVSQAMEAGGSSMSVSGVLALAGNDSRDRGPSELSGGVRVTGLDRLVSMLGTEAVRFSVAQTEAAMRTLSMAFPPASDDPTDTSAHDVPLEQDDESDQSTSFRSKTFDHLHRVYFLKQWRRGGHHRLYLRGDDGEQLGWKDVKSGEVSCAATGADAPLAEAVLRIAQPAAVPFAVGDLPKVAAQVQGLRLLARITGLHIAAVIGHEWRRGSIRRLYGTFVAPETSAIKLGYIDLDSGSLHADIDGPIAKDRGPATKYLAVIHRRHEAIAEGATRSESDAQD